MVGETGDSVDAPVSSDDALRAALPAVFSRARVVITPYPFVAAGGDYLRVISLNSLTGAAIEIHGRQASRGFEGLPFRFPHTPLTNRMPKTEDFPLNEGLVTNLSVQAVTGSPLIGQTFVIIQLVRSVGSVAFVLGTLLQGYVTSTQALGWPGSPIASSIEGGGYYRTIVGTQPAAGAEISETVPTGARWELISFSVEFDASAGVFNRRSTLRFANGAAVVGNAIQGNVVTASQQALLSWAPTLAFGTEPAFPIIQAPMPSNFVLLAGATITTLTSNIQVADQFKAPAFLVREFLEAS